MSVWFQRGETPDGDPFLLEVEEGSPEHDQLVKLGAVRVEGPGKKKSAPAGGDAGGGQGGLESLKVGELKTLAAERGIEVPAKASKAVLLELLAETPDGDGENAGGDPDAGGDPGSGDGEGSTLE